MKTAVVCGAGGFIGHHLVRFLKEKDYWVRGVDLHRPQFSVSDADEFHIYDLRNEIEAKTALYVPNAAGRWSAPDEVYQLAADMGGMGFIHSAECEIMRHNALINLNMIDVAAVAGVKRYFFSSSVCVYRDMAPGESALFETQAYPAEPDNEYGWEKLYSERVALAYARRYGPDFQVRIARFQNCYGPQGTWQGGREKAPAAICRKVAMTPPEGGQIEIWGDGSAVRSYTYVEDMVDGIFRLMQSEKEILANIGSPEYHTVTQLVETIAKVAGKTITIKPIEGPVGVRSRNFSNDRIYSIGWTPNFTLEQGIARTYPWIAEQVRLSQK